jgi:DNA-binding NtrC family response regulator
MPIYSPDRFAPGGRTAPRDAVPFPGAATSSRKELCGALASAAPTLHLLALSDSFSALWPTLASDLGFTLAVDIDPSRIDLAPGAILVVSAGGVEGMVERALPGLGAGGGDLAIVGAVADHRLAVAVIRAGASEYFALPQDHEVLRSWLQERAERLQLRIKGRAFAAREAAKYRFDETMGQSPALRDPLERAARIIPHPTVTVLITGETGTGKELLARAIHYNGPRREAAFVDVNCAAIPEQLLESELFGHEKGAFTGATAAKPGLFEVANRGTLFLDEIGHLSPPLQGKLLRVLEQRTVRRIGDTRSMPVDVRILAATHVVLARSVAEGTFREDLFHRLNVVPIHLPPLRARHEDIVPLARHFLARFAAEYGLPEPALTPAATRALRSHTWPGNVRELRNLMERAVLLAGRPELDVGDLDLAPPAPLVAGGGIPFPATLPHIIRSAASSMTRLCDGNKSEAARRLGISRTRLLRLLSNSNPTDDLGESNATSDP